jgi:hypothetical protein
MRFSEGSRKDAEGMFGEQELDPVLDKVRFKGLKYPSYLDVTCSQVHGMPHSHVNLTEGGIVDR